MTSRLFTIPYFSVKSLRSIAEFEGSPSWFLKASKPVRLHGKIGDCEDRETSNKWIIKSPLISFN